MADTSTLLEPTKAQDATIADLAWDHASVRVRVRVCENGCCLARCFDAAGGQEVCWVVLPSGELRGLL